MCIFPSKKKIILVGWDGDLISELKNFNIKIEGYTSNSKKNSPYKYLGSIKNINNLKKDVGILIPDSDIELKYDVYKKFKNQIVSFISKNSVVPNFKNIGLGSIIQSNVFISENSTIGKCVKINVGCQIHHDSTIGNFSIFGPKVTILGNCKIGKKTFIGSGSIVRNKIKIADNSFIAMGSVVLKDTLKNKKYFGNPAKIYKNINNL